MTTYYLHECVEDLKKMYEFQENYAAGKALSTDVPHFFPKTYQAVLPVGEISAIMLAPFCIMGYCNEDQYPNAAILNGEYYEPQNLSALQEEDNIMNATALPLRIGKNEFHLRYGWFDGEEYPEVDVPLTFNLIPERNHGPVTMTNFDPGEPA